VYQVQWPIIIKKTRNSKLLILFFGLFAPITQYKTPPPCSHQLVGVVLLFHLLLYKEALVLLGTWGVPKGPILDFSFSKQADDH